MGCAHSAGSHPQAWTGQTHPTSAPSYGVRRTFSTSRCCFFPPAVGESPLPLERTVEHDFERPFLLLILPMGGAAVPFQTEQTRPTSAPNHVVPRTSCAPHSFSLAPAPRWSRHPHERTFGHDPEQSSYTSLKDTKKAAPLGRLPLTPWRSPSGWTTRRRTNRRKLLAKQEPSNDDNKQAQHTEASRTGLLDGRCELVAGTLIGIHYAPSF